MNNLDGKLEVTYHKYENELYEDKNLNQTRTYWVLLVAGAGTPATPPGGFSLLSRVPVLSPPLQPLQESLCLCLLKNTKIFRCSHNRFFSQKMVQSQKATENSAKCVLERLLSNSEMNERQSRISYQKDSNELVQLSCQC